jgi:hypothetical protein
VRWDGDEGWGWRARWGLKYGCDLVDGMIEDLYHFLEEDHGCCLNLTNLIHKLARSTVIQNQRK